MEAGVTFYMDEDHYYDLFLAREKEEKWVILRIHIGNAEQIITRFALEQEENAILEVISDKEYAMHKKELHYLGKARTLRSQVDLQVFLWDYMQLIFIINGVIDTATAVEFCILD